MLATGFARVPLSTNPARERAFMSRFRCTAEGDDVVVTGIGGLSKPNAVVVRWNDSADRFCLTLIGVSEPDRDDPRRAPQGSSVASTSE